MSQQKAFFSCYHSTWHMKFQRKIWHLKKHLTLTNAPSRGTFAWLQWQGVVELDNNIISKCSNEQKQTYPDASRGQPKSKKWISKIVSPLKSNNCVAYCCYGMFMSTTKSTKTRELKFTWANMGRFRTSQLSIVCLHTCSTL